MSQNSGLGVGNHMLPAKNLPHQIFPVNYYGVGGSTTRSSLILAPLFVVDIAGFKEMVYQSKTLI